MSKTDAELRAEWQAEQQEAAEKAKRDLAAADLEAFRVDAERRFIDRGGTPDEFKKSWPDIRLKYFVDGVKSPEEIRAETLAMTAPTWRRRAQ